MQNRQSLGSPGGVVEQHAEFVVSEHRREAGLLFESRGDFQSVAIPLLQFGIERPQKENRSATLNRMRRIEQQDRARFIGHAGEVFEVPMRTKRRIAVRVMLAREESTRSKSPRGVAQELWGIALAYNLVRFEAERVAAEAGVPPTRVSFIAALNFIESAFRMWGIDSAGRTPERLRHLREDLKHFILPERRERSYPREVKIKMSGYPKKQPRRSPSRIRLK